MINEEISRIVREAESTKGEIPPEIERLRDRVLASQDADAPQGARKICCKYYSMFRYRYEKTYKHICERSPFFGEVVDDSFCDT